MLSAPRSLLMASLVALCGLSAALPATAAGSHRDRTAVSFNLDGLGVTPLGVYLSRHWEDPEPVLAYAIRQKFFDGITARSLAAEAPRFDMVCTKERCEYVGLVRAHVHSARINPHYLGPTNTLRVVVRAEASQDGQVTITVHKTRM